MNLNNGEAKWGMPVQGQCLRANILPLSNIYLYNSSFGPQIWLADKNAILER